MKLEDLQTGSSVPLDCGQVNYEKPCWLDKDRYIHGQQFFQRHLVPMMLAMHCSLSCGFAITNLLKALVFTKQSDTAPKSIKRYLETFYHLMLWHTGDVWDDPSDKAYQSVRKVKQMHTSVARAMNTEQDGAPEEGISQYDMSLVQCGFMGAVTMYPEGFGIRCSEQELGDYIYFWRCIGFLLGIKDEYNMCSGSYKQTMVLCKQIEQQVLLPSMDSPPLEFHKMATAYFDGLNLFLRVPLYSLRSTFAFVYNGMGLSVPSLGWRDKLRYWFYKALVWCIWWIPFFEVLLNKYTFHTFNKAVKRTKTQ